MTATFYSTRWMNPLRVEQSGLEASLSLSGRPAARYSTSCHGLPSYVCQFIHDFSGIHDASSTATLWVSPCSHLILSLHGTPALPRSHFLPIMSTPQPLSNPPKDSASASAYGPLSPCRHVDLEIFLASPPPALPPRSLRFQTASPSLPIPLSRRLVDGARSCNSGAE